MLQYWFTLFLPRQHRDGRRNRNRRRHLLYGSLGLSKSFRINDDYSVFQTELATIIQAPEQKKHMLEKKAITIYPDSYPANEAVKCGEVKDFETMQENSTRDITCLFPAHAEVGFQSSYIRDRVIMKPTLYFDDRSPPVRSCLLLIKILDIDAELKFVDLFKGEQMKPEFLKVNAAHTVPVLQHNGVSLTDSHAILIYLCETFKGGKDWWPDDKMQRIEVINKLFMECSLLFRRDSDMMSEIIRKGFDNIDLPYHERKILEVYNVLEKCLTTSQYMAGDKMTIADLSFLTTLSTVDLMFQITAEKWPRLCEWFATMQQTLAEHYTQCNAIGLEKLKTIVEKMGKFKFPERKLL